MFNNNNSNSKRKKMREHNCEIEDGAVPLATTDGSSSPMAAIDSATNHSRNVFGKENVGESIADDWNE